MLGFAKKHVGPRSKDIALDRLQMVLVTDRAECSTHVLKLMKQDILEAMRKYVDVDEKDIDIQIQQGNANDGRGAGSRVVADIPITNIKRRK